MKINLHNFFKYYDDKNPKHVNAVAQLQKDIDKFASSLIDDSSNWVRIYRSKSEDKKYTLSVPFYPQTDNYRDPQRTCNSSACAMCLEYFRPGTLEGAQGDNAYIQKVFAIGDTSDHYVQTRVLSMYGVDSKFSYNLSFSDLDSEIVNKRPVVIGILHRGSLSNPTGGHMVVVIGKTANGDYICNDPYGSLNDNYTGPVSNGNNVIYKKSELEKRWTIDGPKSGWGRIFYSDKIELPIKKSDKIPISGLNLIKEFEDCELEAYPDPLVEDSQSQSVGGQQEIQKETHLNWVQKFLKKLLTIF